MTSLMQQRCDKLSGAEDHIKQSLRSMEESRAETEIPSKAKEVAGKMSLSETVVREVEYKYTMSSIIRTRKQAIHPAAQGCSRRAQAVLLQGTVDMDIENCMFTILHQLVRRLGVTGGPGISSSTMRGVSRRTLCQQPPCTPAVGKTLLIYILNGGAAPLEWEKNEMVMKVQSLGRSCVGLPAQSNRRSTRLVWRTSVACILRRVHYSSCGPPWRTASSMRGWQPSTALVSHTSVSTTMAYVFASGKKALTWRLCVAPAKGVYVPRGGLVPKATSESKCTGPKWPKRPFFGQNDLFPNRILAFNGPKWTILVHLGLPTVVWPFLIDFVLQKSRCRWNSCLATSVKVCQRQATLGTDSEFQTGPILQKNNQ